MRSNNSNFSSIGKFYLFVCTLAVIAFVVPAMARTDITMSKGDTWNEVVVHYDCTGEPNLVRAFNLDITVDNGAVITSAPAESFNNKYWVHPGSIDINEITGHVVNKGSAIANQIDFPEDTLGGIDSNGITIEMLSLYTPGDSNQPDESGELFRFTVNKACKVHIKQNGIRAGVVLENPDIPADVNALDYIVEPESTFPNTAEYSQQYADYMEYYNNGWTDEVQSWNAAGVGGSSGYQCHGDADGATQTSPINYRIYANDLALVVKNWRKKMGLKSESDPQEFADPRADIDHKSQTPPLHYRVYAYDLSRIVQNWKKKDADLTANCPLTDTDNNIYVAP